MARRLGRGETGRGLRGEGVSRSLVAFTPGVMPLQRVCNAHLALFRRPWESSRRPWESTPALIRGTNRSPSIATAGHEYTARCTAGESLGAQTPRGRPRAAQGRRALIVETVAVLGQGWWRARTDGGGTSCAHDAQGLRGGGERPLLQAHHPLHHAPAPRALPARHRPAPRARLLPFASLVVLLSWPAHALVCARMPPARALVCPRAHALPLDGPERGGAAHPARALTRFCPLFPCGCF